METEWLRMTVETLKDCNKKYLAQLAKDKGIVGWHAMRKDQLIRALTVLPGSKKGSKRCTLRGRMTVKNDDGSDMGGRDRMRQRINH